MRYPVPENKTIFVRFHRELDNMIREKAEKEGKKYATLITEILSSYSLSPFPLSPISSSFFIKRGRGKGKKIGKGINITMKKVIWNDIRIRGEKEGMKENEMWTSILYTFLESEERQKTSE